MHVKWLNTYLCIDCVMFDYYQSVKSKSYLPFIAFDPDDSIVDQMIKLNFDQSLRVAPTDITDNATESWQVVPTKRQDTCLVSTVAPSVFVSQLNLFRYIYIDYYFLLIIVYYIRSLNWDSLIRLFPTTLFILSIMSIRSIKVIKLTDTMCICAIKRQTWVVSISQTVELDLNERIWKQVKEVTNAILSLRWSLAHTLGLFAPTPKPRIELFVCVRCHSLSMIHYCLKIRMHLFALSAAPYLFRSTNAREQISSAWRSIFTT
jgi:hypothetical protein